MDLWVPVLLSAVLVFVASSVIHMALPIHKGDYKKLPDEAAVMDAVRAQGVQPGEYMFPRAESMKAACSPEMIEKFKRGPVGVVSVFPSRAPAIGKSLVQWFLYLLLISLFTAYVGMLGLARGDEYMKVFRLTGTVAILGYAVTNIPNSIWKGQSWGTTLKFVLDGIVYGLLTAGTLAWLWPDAA